MANTVLLISDEHNPFYTSLYGHATVQTPGMERLASEGTRYSNTYCPSPLCMPCRSAFMSGKWVHQIQAYSNCNVNVDPTPPTYGAVMARQGVHTVHIGKTHVYDSGENLGFSQMILGGAFKRPGDANQRRNPLAVRPDGAQRANGYGPRDNAAHSDLEKIDAALDWLRNTAPTLDKPWVLSVNISNPHFPHYTSQELWDMYPSGGDLPEHGLDCPSAQHPYAQDLRTHFQTGQFNGEQTRGLRRGYLGCVTFVDRQLSRLMDTLEQTGQRDRTNLIYTSDHGEMLGKFGMWWKCSLYDHASRVPLIAAGPDFQQNHTVHTPVSLLDLQATLFRNTGVERPGNWQGTPLQDIPDSDPTRPVFAEYHGHGTRASAYMIRKGPWKYIHYIAAPHQLFNLETDPEELDNIIAAHPDVAADMEKDLRAVCNPERENDRAEAFIQAQLAAIESY